MKIKKDVSLRLSCDQFELLLEVAAMARWVVCAGEKYDDQCYRSAVDDLDQQLLMHALEYGYAESVFACEDDGRLGHIEFEDKECRGWRALQDYGKEVFWQELTTRLALMMAKREVGEAAWDQKSEEDKFINLCDCENRIRDAFELHGLECLMMTSASAAS